MFIIDLTTLCQNIVNLLHTNLSLMLCLNYPPNISKKNISLFPFLKYLNLNLSQSTLVCVCTNFVSIRPSLLIFTWFTRYYSENFWCHCNSEPESRLSPVEARVSNQNHRSIVEMSECRPAKHYGNKTGTRQPFESRKELQQKDFIIKECMLARCHTFWPALYNIL